MWVLKNKLNGKIHLWGNGKDDDFLRYIPGGPLFEGCTKDDIEAHWVDDEKLGKRAHALKLENGKVKLGKKKRDQDDNEFIDFDEEIQAYKIDWPYDERMKFKPPSKKAK